MDLLAEAILSQAAALPPAGPALWWKAIRSRHEAWQSFAMGSSLDFCLLGWEAVYAPGVRAASGGPAAHLHPWPSIAEECAGL